MSIKCKGKYKEAIYEENSIHSMAIEIRRDLFIDRNYTLDHVFVKRNMARPMEVFNNVLFSPRIDCFFVLRRSFSVV
jgi:hypothetical protein